ncbi:MAG: hypothetical protein Fur0041_06270 [Bacteroidia bacterium]
MSDKFISRFLILATVTLVLLYLVVLAGSVVRASGSGMGCPDWPKCFGYYIPPTDPWQVEFHPNEQYEKGRMIISNDTLWRAVHDFTSGVSFDRTHWEKYPKHNYAKFVVYQTWTEYINRLLGLLSGLSLLILSLFSLRFWNKDRVVVWALIFAFVMILFVSWLGAVVVETNLKPVSITLHMASALIMIGVVIYTQSRVQLKFRQVSRIAIPSTLYYALTGALLLTIAQVYFGTQVRQQIDTIKNNMDGLSRETWIDQLNNGYWVHIIIGGAALLLNTFAVYQFVKNHASTSRIKRLALCIGLIVWGTYGAGVLMHKFAIPAFVQPVHLLFAVILFGLQFALIIRSTKKA